MKVALISTFLNEAHSIESFLSAIETQTRKPDEVILVDGGSSDGSDLIAQKHPLIRLIRAPGNRSMGRNAAINATNADVIAATDLGCVPRPDWLENIVAPLEQDPQVDLVMGWTVPPESDERRRAATAVLTVPIEQVDQDSTRPSTRSVAFRRTRVDPFPEQFSHNEDAVWFISLRKKGLKFVFRPQARVVWSAPSGAAQIFEVVERYGRGDGEAGLDPGSYAKVALELAGLAATAILSIPFTTPRVLLVAGLTFYVTKMRKRAISTLRNPGPFQSLVRVPAYGLVVKFAQVVGFFRGTLRRRPGP